MSIAQGNVITDSDALAALEVPADTAQGTKIWNVDVDAYFTYTSPSSAALVTDQVVAVANVSGARWIKDTTVIADGAVTTAKLADGAVTTAKLADANVTAAKIATIAQDVWFNSIKAAMVAAVPELTGFDYIRPSQTGNGAIASTVAADPALEGGGIGVASDTTWLRLVSETVFQTPKTGKWAVAFRGKFPANTGTALFALLNSGATHYVSFGVLNGHSKFLFEVVAAGTTNTDTATNADTSVHNFMMYSDGTTITLTIDGTSAGTIAASGLSTDPLGIAIFGAAALTPGVCVQKVAYGYVAP